jgi:ribose transport system ATP-binding protein
MKGLLQAVSITRHFGPVIALDSVNFTARPGEIHALLGENGAGKTTLMHVIAGHLRPDGGVVMLDGVSLRSGSPQVALRAGIATVHQSPMLFERLSVAENLAMGGFVRRGLALDEVAQKASVLARSLGFSLPSPDASLDELSIAQKFCARSASNPAC